MMDFDTGEKRRDWITCFLAAFAIVAMLGATATCEIRGAEERRIEVVKCVESGGDHINGMCLQSRSVQ